MRLLLSSRLHHEWPGALGAGHRLLRRLGAVGSFPEAEAFAVLVVHAFHRGFPKQDKRWYSSRWPTEDRLRIENVARAVFTDPELRAALESAYRLSARFPDVRKLLLAHGRVPSTSEAKRAAIAKGVKARSLVLAKRAERELGKAQTRLNEAERAAERARAGVKRWQAKVEYHRKRGTLETAPDE